MKDLVISLGERIDKLIETSQETKADIADIKADLKYHIKRTDLLEEKMVSSETRQEHVENHVTKVENISRFLMKSLSVIAILTGIVATIYKLM